MSSGKTLYIMVSVLVMLAIPGWPADERDEELASDEEKISLTLEKCVELALKRNPQYQSILLKAGAKKMEVNEARAALYYPTIELAGRYTYTDQTPESTFPVANHKFSTSLGINYILYAFGRFGDQLDAARQNHEIAILEAKKARNDLVKSVTTAFHTVLLNQKTLKVTYNMYVSKKKNIKYQEKKAKLGKIGRFNYLRLKSQFENERMEVQKLKNQLVVSMNHLLMLLNEKPISSFEEYNYKLKSFNGFKEDDKKYPPVTSVQECLKAGDKSHRDLQIMKARKRVMELTRDSMSSAYKPVVSVFGNYIIDYSQQLEFQLPTSPLSSPGFGLGDFTTIQNYNFGVQISIPISEFLIPNSKTRSKVDSLDYQVRSLDMSLIQLKSSVEREIIKNYLEFNEAKKNVKTLKELMEMAKELYKIAKRRFDTGGLDFLNYRDVEAQALRGEIAYHRGVYQCYLAYYNLLISMGVDLS